MLRKIASLTICGSCCIAFAATTVSHQRYRDETARTEYTWIHGGVSTTLAVRAAKTRLKQDGVTVDSGPSVSISYSAYNFCDLSNTEQTFWTGTSDTAAFNIDSNLRSARLVASSIILSGMKFTGLQETNLGTKSVSVDITWSS